MSRAPIPEHIHAHLSDPNFSFPYFLTDRPTIGPLTGLSMRGAVLDLFDLPSHLPPAAKKNVTYAMRAIYLMRGERKKADLIIEHQPDVLSYSELADLDTEACSLDGERHIPLLLEDYHQLRLRRKHLERILAMEDYRLKNDIPTYQSDRELREAEWQHRRYITLRELLGTSLAEGRMSAAMRCVDMIQQQPEWEEQELNYHTCVVARFLDNGGERMLRKAGIEHLTETYIGTEFYPGKFRDFWRANADTVKVNASIAAIMWSLLETGEFLSHHYHITNYIKQGIELLEKAKILP